MKLETVYITALDDLRKALPLGVLLLCAILPAGCPSGTEPTEAVVEVDPLPEEGPMDNGRSYFIENVSGIALVQLYADGFEQLPLQQKLLAYYLYKAAVAGRDITYDQNHRWSLAIRQLLDGIVSHPLGLTPETEQRITEYAKLLWLNNGPFFERNKTKIPVPFSREELAVALGTARANGADFSALGQPLEDVLMQLDPLLFDPLFEPQVTNKNPGAGGDILRDSAGNYYSGVTMKDLEGFKESYPLNSKLVKECPRKGPCRLVEQVYRTGMKDERGKKWKVEPGLYATQLEAVVANLEKAKEYASPGQAKNIEHLVRFFRTGDPAEFDQASIAWLSEDPDVDFILGFIESYKDPRSQKAEYEGLVYYRDADLTRIMRGIAESARYFEQRVPWDERYRNLDIRVPVASAINVLIGVGGAGPSIPAGINLPNAQWIREKHGSRSVLLSNVMGAARAAVSDKAVEEFALPEDLAASKRYRKAVGNTMVALHEIVGHGSGRASPKLQEDPSYYLKEYYSTLEEARAELVALHHVFDQRLVEIGALPGPEAAVVAMADYIRGDLVQLRRVKKGNRFEDDHMRASHLIVQYIMRNTQAVEIRKVQDRTFFVLKDLEQARASVATLLAEVMRVKAEGDFDAGRRLVETYGIEFDPVLRDEVVARAERAGVPDFVAFHVPSVRLVAGADGKPADVVVDYSRDFVTNMLEWDIMGPQ